VILRLAAGLAIAGLVAWAAKRSGSLDASGARAATLVGGMAVGAGWGWGSLLIGWFIASSLLTKLGNAKKAARTRATLATGSARNAWQVWANGGVFSGAALMSALTGNAAWTLVAVGALAAAAADTWSTELGLLFGGAPRSIVSGRLVEPGLSGGITLAGSLGGALGAVAVALAAASLAPSASFARLALAGVLGGVGDSLLGATVQAVRRCARCGAFTERATHDCGTATDHARGWRWMSNDTVNLAATLIGAGAALLLPIP
jgi:uncharacterized protein (TIGR00297 family)